MLKQGFSVALLAIAVTPVALAQSSDGNGPIGYPTVAAALADLQQRDGLTISVQRGWTIIEDKAARVLWSFTPSAHPAHPSVVRRAAVGRDGAVALQMDALCETQKQACDQLIAEFKVLNQRMQAYLRSQARARQSQWQPTEEYRSRAVALVDRFTTAIDGERFREAYDLFAPSLKAMLSFDQFTGLKQKLDTIGGGKPARGERRITWYKDPPRARNGVFAAFDIACKVPKQSYCAEIIILHEPPGGAFQVIRQETNFVDPETRRRLERKSR